MTGSVGTGESTIQTEHLIGDLAELNQLWGKLAGIEAHRQWGKDLEPYVVSGSNRWGILRVIGP